ncbi:PAS domain S-box protein [Flavivirga sp. 57AJ16]|uniref:PAS domain S-box protein n=1 Tax=Flavivirga sp. 57AJ16 TaxID=3025307 RepID=UPI002365C663|nr:PAS domain S-box protein [Flavivirga sp. 57AJ16]MDD7886964.1 PAS domain S-box protein [Flavivirga sp. 57AJ16]
MKRTDIELLQELKQEIGFSESFIESLEDGLIIINLLGRIVMVNSAFSCITGFKVEELTNIGFPFPFWPPESREEFSEGFKKMLKSNIDGEHETTHVRKDGTYFPVKVFVAAIKNRNNEVIAHLGLIEGITGKKSIAYQQSKNKDIFSVLNYRKKYLKLITEKKLVSQLDLTLNNISDGLVVLDSNWCYTYINKKAAKILNKKPDDLIGKNTWEVYPEAVNKAFYTIYHKALKTQETQYFQEYYEPFDKWFENRVYPSPEGLAIYFTDITEKKRTEDLVLRSERYLENIINNIGDPVFVKDEESRLVLVNNAFLKIFNLDKIDVLGKTLAEDVAPEERDAFLRIDRQVLKDGIENINEESLTIRKGETRIISTKKTRFIDDDGNKFLVGVIRDITDRKQAENDLKTAKEYSEALIDSMQEGLVVFDIHTEIISVNPAFCKMSGFSEMELVGKQCPYPFSPPEIEEESNLRHERLERGELIESFESVYMRKDGSRFNVHVMISSINDADGKMLAYFGTIIDITERRKAEQDLKSAKEFTDKLIMSMQEGLIIVDLNGKIIMVNESTCKILGYEEKELLGLDLPYPFVKKEDFEKISKTNERVAQGEALSFQFEFIRKNGEKFMASFLAGNIKNDKGEVVALFGTMKDISEEEKLKNTLKVNALKSEQKKEAILKLANLVGKEIDYAFKNITKLSAETLNVNRVSVWSFNEVKNEIFCERLYDLKSDSFEKGSVIRYEQNPLYFNELDKNQTILINDAQTSVITKGFVPGYLVPNNIKSLMDVSINSSYGYYGIVCFEHVGGSLRKWTSDDQSFATSIASIVSLMVESTERKLAEKRILLANEKLVKVNNELSELKEQLVQENIYLRNELDLVFNYEEMVYGSVEFSNVLTEVEKVAPTNATVLLLGESGTGKELLARAIHNTSQRNKKPLIKVNCSAIPRELIESELFGHKKGSFTGAFSDKIGKFELADGGTLFLDEIGELPLDMQPKILRFLQEGEIEVIGGTKLKKLDVRVIAATNRNLREEIEKKQFREDLFFRLNVFPIEIPPLRKRIEDIPLLVEHFVDKFNKAYEKNIKYILDETMALLKSHHWPGNIRELENLIERALILSNSDTLMVPGFETTAQKNKQQQFNGKDFSLDTAQKNHIVEVLDRCNWKISGEQSASNLLNMKPSTLRDKMNKLGIKKSKHK